jgi:tetratricopeptide (TPR) repeat protein
MKATINFRFLIGLLVAIVVMGGATVGVHALQIGRESGFLLEQARRARDDKDFPLAAKRYQQYTKLVPKNFDALAEYGVLLADHHSGRPASDALEKVLRVQPDRDDLRRKVVDMEMETGRYTDAEDHLKQYLMVKTPDDPELWKLLGTCQAAAGEFQASVDSFAGEIHLDPHQVEAYAYRAELLRRHLDRANEADQAMQDLVKANPGSAKAHAMLGQYLQANGQEKEGLAEAVKAATIAPKDADALLLVSRLTATSGDYDKALDYAQRAIDVAPAKPLGYIILSRLQQRTDRKKAIATLEKGAEKTEPKSAALLWELGRVRVDANQLADAEKSVEELKALPNEAQLQPLIEMLQAQIDYGYGHWKKASQGFELVIPAVKHSPELLKEAHFQLARAYNKLGNAELELAEYREAAHVDPTWAPARLALASTLVAQGKYDEALDEYRQISKLKGLEKAGQEGVARVIVAKSATQAPGQKSSQELNTALDELGSDKAEATTAELMRADVAMNQNHPEEAEQILLTARDKTPDKVQLWSALMSFAERQQHWDRMAGLITEAKAKFGDQVWLRLADGSCLVGRNKKLSATMLAPLGDNAEAYSGPERVMLYSGLAKLSAKVGDLVQAKKFCRLACDADPNNLATRELLMEFAFQTNDAEGMTAVLKEIKGLEGEGPYWHYGQAALTLLNNSSSETAAFEHLTAAHDLRPNWSRVPMLMGQIHDKHGEIDPALDEYLKAIDLGERSPAAIRRTVELLYSRQRYAEVDQLLRKLDQSQANLSDDFIRLKSEIKLRTDDPVAGLDIARKAAADSKNWRDHLWLGQLLTLLGQRAEVAQRTDESQARFGEAEKSLREAVKLGAEIPDTWVTLIRFYAATGRKHEAEAMIPKAEKWIVGPAAPFALGACYETVGDMDSATKQYQKALAAGEQDPRVVRRVVAFYLREGKFDAAEAPLRKIVSGKVTAKPEDVTWARRALASVLRASGNYQKLQEALALLEKNIAAGSSPDDLWEKALALAASPQRERRQEAIALLEKLLPAQADIPEVRLTLAQLYLAEKDWPKAAEQFRRILTSHDREPRYITIFVSRLLERRESDEADVWLSKLDLLAPGEFSTISLKAEALVVREQVDVALEMIRTYLTQATAKAGSAPERAAILRQVATYLEALSTIPTGLDAKVSQAKLLSEAEGLYRRYVKELPEQELVLASFLARREYYDDALTVAEEAWPNATLAGIVRVTGDMLASGISDPAQCAKLEKLLVTASEKFKQPTVMLLELADLRNRQEHLAAAESDYRMVLKQESGSFVAMNNLAVLLAQQKKKLPEALELIGKAIEIAGPQPTLLDSRATVYLAMGKPQQAIVDLLQAVHDEPRADREYHLALANWRAGDSKAASDALDQAKKMGLKPEQLNSLERPEYQELVVKLQQ